MSTVKMRLQRRISADADGGPRSRVRTAGHSAQPPIYNLVIFILSCYVNMYGLKKLICLCFFKATLQTRAPENFR